MLLRDIQRGEDPQLRAIEAIIAKIAPDILVLTDFDYDLDGLAMAAFAASLDQGYVHDFALQPNAGMATGLDIDGNGRLGDARDAQGYGRFAGDGGMAVLSRFPVIAENAQDLSQVLWRDLPGAILPTTGAAPFLSDATQDVLRLSSTGHWIVPIALPDGSSLALMAYSATPPVFDGPEDMNGLRNRDELRMWEVALGGAFGQPPADFVIVGNANLDPQKGEGYSDAMQRFLRDPRLQDPLPNQDTADWPDNGPGRLRVSYVLPTSSWTVVDAGVFWPAPDDPDRSLIGDDGLAAGPHRLVWVDISR